MRKTTRSLPLGKVLFYCQHLLGIGHLSRSLNLCRSLAEDFDIRFLQGGPDNGLSLTHPRFTRTLLAPLLMRESDAALFDPVAGAPLKAVFDRRRREIANALEEKYDYFIVELFPFGRKKFAGEILHTLGRVRERNPDCRILCSLRDILVKKKDEHARAAKHVALVREHFDRVLVHSDPRILRLEETFPMAGALKDRIVYTGFVAGPPPPSSSARREDRILISMGGGIVGDELVAAMSGIAGEFPKYEFAFVMGPFTKPGLRARVRARRRTSKNIRILDFCRDFEEVLRRCRLSVSLAGYNTVMNLLNTRTPALVFPYRGNREQLLRARRFEEKGLLRVLLPQDLRPDRLARALAGALRAPYPSGRGVRLDGAETTRRLLARGWS